MKCKICGAPLIGSAPQIGSFVITATCNCGKVRNRVRKEGCSKCGAHGTEISLVYRTDNTFYAFCECGNQWTVIE